MKKFLFALVFATVITGCSLLTQVESASPNAEIERLVLPDSTCIYFINYRGHIYIYNSEQHHITEIFPIK